MAQQDRDYYEVLGIPRDADEKTIKTAYHKLAMHWHPDRNPSAEANEKFKEIAKAYAILKDPKKRARYDAQGMEGVAHFTTDDLFGDLDLGNLFGDMGLSFGGGSPFDRMFGFGREARQPAQGQDLRLRANVPLMLINSGGQYEIQVSHPVACDICHGYGTAHGKPPPLCSLCHGSGRKIESRTEQRGSENVRFQQVSICPLCHGKGTQIEAPCLACAGYGKVEKAEKLMITIPQGIEDGMVLRVAGHGLPADKPELPPGDLYVSVYAAPDDRFQRRHADLWRAETIDAVDAVLGTQIQVPTLDGLIKVKIPPGTQPDDSLRIKGKGLPHYEQTGRGDLILRIMVHIPEKLEHEQEQLYKQIRQAGKKST